MGKSRRRGGGHQADGEAAEFIREMMRQAAERQAREAQERVLRQRAVATGREEKDARDAFEERFRVMEKDHMFSGGDHRLVHGGVLLRLEQTFELVRVITLCGRAWLCVSLSVACACTHSCAS